MTDEMLNEQIIQDLVAGVSVPQVVSAYNVDIEYVGKILESPRFSGDNRSKYRKAIQLARLDVATKALMPAVAKGDSAAIDIYLKVAKREASLLGLDAPTNSTVEANHIVTVHAPWMSPSRLAYLDNVTEATSVETIRIPS